MKLPERIKRYQAIEAFRKRPLITYATSTRPGLNAMMAGDAVREFIDQLDQIQDGDAVDILIHSTGGDGLTAWKIMSIIRERFKKVGVLVPSTAFSAATLFALGADEIVMHPHASLGPIDPQIRVGQADGQTKAFAYEDIGGFLRFLTEDVKIGSEPHLTALADKLLSSVDPVVIGVAKRASALSAEVGARLLSTHMPDADRAKEIALKLNKAFFAHSDAVSRSRAKELGLKIAEANPELERLIWSAYLGLEEYMLLRTPFNALVEFYADAAGAQALAPTAALSLPPNTPPPMADQVWNAVLSQAIQKASGGGVEVERETIAALIESSRCASQHRTRRRISAVRLPNLEVKISMVDIASAWESIQIPT